MLIPLALKASISESLERRAKAIVIPIIAAMGIE